MGSRRRSRVGWCLVLAAGLVGSGGLALGVAAQEAADVPESAPEAADPNVLHDGFETPAAVWRREHTDTTINLLAQERSDRAANDGRLSERFQFEAEPGSQFFVSYPLPNVPVTDALEASLAVRANRAGVQLFVRVVLPKDVDPESRAASFVLIPGTVFDRVDRWQRLEVSQIPPAVERQARVLRASSSRPVPLEGAYIDCVVVNLMGGQGGAEVFLDNLSVGPVAPEIVASWTPPGAGPARPEALPELPAAAPAAVAEDGARGKFDRIRLDRNYLSRLGDDQRVRPWFPTAVEAPGADVTELRRYGFDVLIDGHDADRDRLAEAVERGFLLMPRLSRPKPGEGIEGQLKQVTDYPFKDSTAFWMLGEDLGRNRERKVRDEELARTRKLNQAIHALPPTFSRLTVGEVRGELPLYARAPSNLDAIAIPTNHWAAAQDQSEFHRFLLQRRELTAKANAGQLYWAMLPASAPRIVEENIWGEAPPPAWGVPRPSPEHLRLMTYLALSAGYRGLIFRGDADLTRPAGRPQLIESALLNMEIDLVESILAKSADPIPIHPVFDPPPSDLPPPGSMPTTRVRLQPESRPKAWHRAAAISVDRRGALLLLADYSDNVQYQPHQLATRNLVVRAILPEGVEAFDISPGGVDVLEHKRGPGGTYVTVEEFGVTSMILCTTDMALKERLEMAIARARPTAVQLAIEQAELMYQQVAEINGRLAADGVSITSEEDERQRRALGLTKPFNDAAELLAKAEASVKSARDARDREDFGLAWKEARRAQRPLRILAYAHWVEAYKALALAVDAERGITPETDAASRTASRPPEPQTLMKPTSCPPLVTFNTLPELYVWLDWISGKSGYRFGANRVPSGAFDDPAAMADDGWMNMSYEADGIKAAMAVVPPDVPVPTGSAPADPANRAIRMNATPADPKALETSLPPFVDHPLVAVRSPALKVLANNLIRISVLVRRPMESAAGAGGLIVRDSIGGEALQFRTTAPIANWSRVVLYRKAPADGEFTATLGLAGYGAAWFDDFRVELVEQQAGDVPGDLADAPDGEDLDSIPDPDPAADSESPAAAASAAAAPAAPPADLDGTRRESAVPRLPDPRVPAAAESPEQNRARRR
ncbi:hypothetical protein [Planctomyces sp. SH-PL62]|uniref:hypothetical protein n=1 Tax=Planctomyces sp. SH-PL62 TaxID=1636152 RepID=UPI00078DA270|nr:hypothetical protein [Planctomyces sp. SH-PL62]AMV37657.1 hypothetical protein VT85_09490 [Planctomyces sp. SH-PL62]